MDPHELETGQCNSFGRETTLVIESATPACRWMAIWRWAPYLVLACAALQANAKDSDSAVTEQPWPACLVAQLPDGANRFSDASYRALMLGDTIASATPEGLFRVSAAAADRREGYKALYFARLLTQVAPTNSQAWKNRETLANKLGLADEAAASAKKSDQGTSAPDPVASVLPGRPFGIRPASIADYAALMNMMADDTAASIGRPVLLAVSDHVSGLLIPTEAEIEQRGHPFAQSQPLKLADIPNNAVILGDASPMSKKIAFGAIAGGLLAAAAAGYTLDQGLDNALDTTVLVLALSDVAGESFHKAANTPSKFSGGSFHIRRIGKDGKWVDEKRKPQTTGELDVVGLPMPILWASGGSRADTVTVELSYKAVLKKDPIAPQMMSAGGTNSLPVTKKLKGIQAYAPRIETLCVSNACWSGAANEFMLSEEELSVLFGESPEVSEWIEVLRTVDRRSLEAAYDSSPDSTSLTQARQPTDFTPIRRQLIAYDRKGNCYALRIAPDQWVVGTSLPKTKR